MHHKGIDVFQFTDAIKALEHLKLHKGEYGVMISDLRMPIVNGVQLLKRKGCESLGKNNFSYRV
jgi:DNA-binding NtrC family response regulator